MAQKWTREQFITSFTETNKQMKVNIIMLKFDEKNKEMELCKCFKIKLGNDGVYPKIHQEIEIDFMTRHLRLDLKKQLMIQRYKPSNLSLDCSKVENEDFMIDIQFKDQQNKDLNFGFHLRFILPQHEEEDDLEVYYLDENSNEQYLEFLNLNLGDNSLCK